MTPIALADDGALLATVDMTQGPVTFPSLSPVPTPILTLYRLPAGSSMRQSLGALPHGTDVATGNFVYGNLVYCAGPGQGLLWSTGDGTTTLTAAYP